MDNFVSTIAVLALTGVIVLLFVKALRTQQNTSKGKTAKDPGGTILVNAKLYVETISDTGSLIGVPYPVTSIGPDGVTIGRAGGGADIELEMSDVWKTVSRIHLRLMKDKIGLYLFDVGSSNGTFDENSEPLPKILDENDKPLLNENGEPLSWLPIEKDEQVLCLGRQWIRIRKGNKGVKFRGSEPGDITASSKKYQRPKHDTKLQRPPFRGGDYYT